MEISVLFSEDNRLWIDLMDHTSRSVWRQSRRSGFIIFNYRKDTIWGVDRDANMLYPNFQFRGVITKTTNAGLNWGYQNSRYVVQNAFFVFCSFLILK